MAECYNKFADFYDRLTANADYPKIAGLINDLIKQYSDYDECIVDLACGTGSLSIELAKIGYYVVGVDLSENMLEAAKNKCSDISDNTEFLCQNMTELDLYGAADVVVCILDSLNHLKNNDELKQTFERVSMFTCDGGLFIFDLNTRYKHREILNNNAFNFSLDGIFCAWQNELNEKDDSVDIYLDFFELGDDGKYSRYSESFKEILFDENTIDSLIKDNDFEIIGRFDDFSEDPPNEKSQRILYVCKRKSRED